MNIIDTGLRSVTLILSSIFHNAVNVARHVYCCIQDILKSLDTVVLLLGYHNNKGESGY